MARAKASKWLGIVTGLALTPAGVQAAPLSASLLSILPVAEAPGQSMVRPSRTRMALTNGIEAHRKGDYDTASTLFAQAQAGLADLSASEQQDLASYQQANAAALKGRRDGAAWLRQAEAADREGKTLVAADLMKKVAVTLDYLAPADRQKAQLLSDKLVGRTPTNATPAALARAKLQQGRAMLAQGNVPAAEQLAGEAARVPTTFAAAEDSPAKLLEDITKFKNDPKALMAAGRAAFQRGDLDRADQLAQAADKVASSWTFPVWSDTPTKLRKEIQAAKVAKGATPKNEMKAPTDTVKASKPDVKAEEARKLLHQGREALNAGNLELAAKLADQVAAMNPDLPFWEENPDKLRGDIQRAKAAKQPTATAATKPASEDPRELLKKGTDLYKAGKLDEALVCAQKAKASNTKWGLFEDGPDRLLADLEKARGKRDQDESAKVLVDARKRYEEGELEKAKELTYKAEKLHGPYSLWDLGDRPQKLRGEIETAQAKGRKTTIPAVPGTALAKGQGPKLETPPDDGKAAQAKQLLVEARVALKAGDMSRAANLANQARGLKVVSTNPGDDTPDKVMHDVVQARITSTAVAQQPLQMPSQSPVPAAPANPPTPVVSTLPSTRPSMTLDAGNAAKTQAQQLVVQAQQLQRAGKLVEARQKCLEAMNLKVTFSVNETGPDQVLLALSALIRQRTENLVMEADDCLAKASSNPALYAQAEANLQQAHQLAVGFGQDTMPIEAKMSFVRQQAKTQAVVQAAPTLESPPVPVVQMTAVPPPTPVPGNQGHEMLEKARLELRRGDTTTARKLTMEAFKGPFGVQTEAAQVLRSIDAEEEGQRRLTANRTFDAGQSAYFRKDYAHAGSILRSIDPTLLDPQRQARLKELTTTPELGDYNLAKAPAVNPPAAIVRTSAQEGPGAARASDGKGEFQSQEKALHDIKFQQLRQKGLEVQKEAGDRFKTGDTDRALEVMQEYLTTVSGSTLDPDSIGRLKAPVERRLAQFRTLKAQRDLESERTQTAKNAAASHEQKFLVEQKKEKRVAELMKQYNVLYKEGKYKDAETQAMLAHELDPDNTMVVAALTLAERADGKKMTDRSKKSREDNINALMDEAEYEGPVVTSEHPLDFNKERWTEANRRKALNLPVSLRRSEKAVEIEHRLNAPTTLNFKNEPLSQVLDDLRNFHSINIVVDEVALKESLVDLSHPMTLKLEGVKLKSALKCLLDQVQLTYVIEDEVLKITSEAHARGKLVTMVYPVGDLVIPIHNYGNPTQAPRATDGGPMPPTTVPASMSTSTPYASPFSMANGQPVGQASMTTAGQSVTVTGPKQTMEDALMNLIQSTIAPRSWTSQGGQASIEYFGPTLSLAVNQTLDIQEQVADLLAALRRLQDQEVSVEIRFVSIAESFFERIGVDFNINILTKNKANQQLQFTTNNFQPQNLVNSFAGNGFVTGLTPAGTFTTDLNIPVRSSSFGLAVPPFGNFPNIPGGNGGIELGLAFLSDIQVFMFMEAAQGDNRTNIMQAPKLTLFNGQTSTLNITDSQFFVTNVAVNELAGRITFIPQNQSFQTGFQVNVQAVISADRRFVRLNIPITVNNLASPLVGLFPVVTPVQTFFEGGFLGTPINFTQFLQQPQFNTITIQTTVAVPDGGTVLMGGLKRLSEGRNEYGPPVLSKIPYINRLFKNVGYGRDTESIMILVTPRIIINEEEEIKQTGVISNPPQ